MISSLRPETTDFEIRLKAKQLIDFHRARGRAYRKLVLALKSGALIREELCTAIVEGTCLCYAENTMSIYNGNEVPHPDVDLYLNMLPCFGT